MDNIDKERRKYLRSDIPIKIFIYTPDKKIFATYTNNISANGLCVMVNWAFNVDDIIKMELHFDDREVMCNGRVVWVQKLPHENLHTIGIEFLDVIKT